MGFVQKLVTLFPDFSWLRSESRQRKSRSRRWRKSPPGSDPIRGIKYAIGYVHTLYAPIFAALSKMYFTFTALHSADKFSNEHQISGFSMDKFVRLLVSCVSRTRTKRTNAPPPMCWPETTSKSTTVSWPSSTQKRPSQIGSNICIKVRMNHVVR